MNTPHKHADVLRAIADGKAVQWRRAPHGWEDHWNDLHGNPLDCLAEIEWRIKPEPKPDVVVYGMAVRAGMRTAFYSFVAQHYSEDNLRLVFDGETGKLKSAEVLP